MQFFLKPMTESDAARIAGWHYGGIYSFYDMDQDPDDLAELLDPANWENLYRSVLDEQGELIGFFCFQAEGDTVEVGLGLRPDLTGQGLGRAFLEAGLAYAAAEYRPVAFRLAVATFNERAIRLYEQAGFRRTRIYPHETNGATYEFQEMVRR